MKISIEKILTRTSHIARFELNKFGFKIAVGAIGVSFVVTAFLGLLQETQNYLAQFQDGRVYQTILLLAVLAAGGFLLAKAFHRPRHHQQPFIETADIPILGAELLVLAGPFLEGLIEGFQSDSKTSSAEETH